MTTFLLILILAALLLIIRLLWLRFRYGSVAEHQKELEGQALVRLIKSAANDVPADKLSPFDKEVGRKHGFIVDADKDDESR